jgi:hypothetical protein
VDLDKVLIFVLQYKLVLVEVEVIMEEVVQIEVMAEAEAVLVI